MTKKKEVEKASSWCLSKCKIFMLYNWMPAHEPICLTVHRSKMHNMNFYYDNEGNPLT